MKRILKWVWLLATVVLIGSTLLNYRNNKGRKEMELDALQWMRQNIVQEYSCSIEDSDLESVIQSIDTVVNWSLSQTIENEYTIVNKEMGQLYLLHNHKQVNFKEKLLSLYESDSMKYKFLNDKFEFNNKYWFDEHYKDKTLIEILMELQQIRVELMYLCNTSTRAN